MIFRAFHINLWNKTSFRNTLTDVYTKTRGVAIGRVNEEPWEELTRVFRDLLRPYDDSVGYLGYSSIFLSPAWKDCSLSNIKRTQPNKYALVLFTVTFGLLSLEKKPIQTDYGENYT